MKRGQYDYPRAEWALPVMVTAENWRDLAEDVDVAVADVANGYDPVAAGNLIRFFHFALRDGALFDHCTNLTEAERGMLDFVAMAFGRYVEGSGKKSLDHAFGVDRGRGNTNKDNGDRNITIAACVEQAIREEKKARGTAKIEPICRGVADRFNLGWKTVEKIHSDFSVSIKTLGDAEIFALTGVLLK